MLNHAPARKATQGRARAYRPRTLIRLGQAVQETDAEYLVCGRMDSPRVDGCHNGIKYALGARAAGVTVPAQLLIRDSIRPLTALLRIPGEDVVKGGFVLLSCI
jgi:hypothetical protein